MTKRRSFRLGLAASAGSLALTLLTAACTTEASEDPLPRELRRRVEKLEAAARAAPTDATNYADRVTTLWEWSNALALAGRNLPVNLPREVWVARTAAATGKTPDPALLRMLDQRIRGLALEEADPSALGELRFGSTDPLVAGSWVTLEQTWTVGSRPLVAGGKIVIAKQLATDQGRFQAEDPAGDHYVSLRSSDPTAVLRPSQVALLGMHGAFRGNTPTLAFELEGATLGPGETVTVTYGDRSKGSRGWRTTTFSTDAFLLPIYLDLDGKGDLLGPRWPSLRVVGEETTSRVTAFAPSIVAAGEPFDLLVRAEDRYWNRASGPVPAWEVRLGDQILARVAAAGSPATKVENLRIIGPGAYRLAVVSADGELSTQSNPIWVEASPRRRVLWGETHVHGGFSEGQGTAEGLFHYAVEDSRLDFLGYSEHDIYMDDAEWKTLQDLARRFGDGGELIPFLGYEWTAETPNGGHHNVFFRTPDRARVPVQEAPLLPDLYRGLAAANQPGDVLVIPHAHEAGDWTRSDPELERLVEIYSMHGTFEWFGNLYLKRGWRVGFIGASDEHRAKPGHSPAIPALGPLMQIGGLAAVIAPERSRDAVFDALRGLSAYAVSSGQRILLDASLNGHGMGTRQASTSTRRLTVKTSGTAPIDHVDVVRNGEVLFTRHYLTAPLEPETTWLQVGFESTSDAFDAVRENPRGWRWWEGTVEIARARVAEVATPGIDNTYEEWVREEADRPGTLRFRLATRGRRDVILLRLEGAGRETTLRFRLDPTREWGFLGGTVRPDAQIPAHEATLSLVDLVDGRLEHAIPVDVHTDRITLQTIDPLAPLDQSFELTDTSGVGDGDYYYVRVTQLDGARAWSSPFWVGERKKDR
jgi:uncharacterized protein DUF3604